MGNIIAAAGRWGVVGSLCHHSPESVAPAAANSRASLLVQALGLVSPLFTQLLIDQILPTRSLDLLTLLAVGVLILTAAHAIFSFIRALALLVLLWVGMRQVCWP